jgi:hypothetical protein
MLLCIPEDGSIYNYRLENITSYKLVYILTFPAYLFHPIEGNVKYLAYKLSIYGMS